MSKHEELTAALLTELRHDRQTQTEKLELIAGEVVNHVLSVELITIPAEGFVTRQWHLPCGSVAVTPHTPATTLTIVSGTATSNTPPSNGIGVALALGGSAATPANASVVNIAARAVTIYGPPAAQFTLQAFTKPQPPR